MKASSEGPSVGSSMTAPSARALQETEERLRAVWDTAADAMALSDQDGVVLMANPAYCALYGYAPDEVVGHDFALIFPEAERSRARADYRAVFQSPTIPPAFEATIRRADGSSRIVESRATFVTHNGQRTAMLSIIRDMTEHRQLERAAHDTLDALLAMARTLVLAPDEVSLGTPPLMTGANVVAQRLAELTGRVLRCPHVGIVVIDPTTDALRPVAVMAREARFARAWWTRVEGTRLDDALDEASLARLRAGEVVVLDMAQSAYSGRDTRGARVFPVAPLRVDGRLIGLLRVDYGGQPHEYTSQERALMGAIGQLAALVIEREQLRSEQQDARAREIALHEANRRMDAFLSTISHELRTPLTPLQGYLQLLIGLLPSEEADAPAHRYAAVALEQAQRLTRLVNALMDVSQMQAGPLAMRAHSADLTAIVQRSVSDQRDAWPSRTLRAEVPLEAMPVLADPDRIGQVVTNYVTNALKYSAVERPVVVSLQRADGEAYVRVRDEGPGLAPEQQERVWERYQRVEETALRDASHSSESELGLGLYLSRAIIERHGGRVGVESEPGHGATFWFMLPLALPG